MSLRTRKAQWAFAEEGTPGTAETLTAAHVVKIVSESPNIENLEPVLFDDFSVKPTLGDLPQFAPGIASWSPTVTVALAGHSASDSSTITKLPYGRLIEACGFEALDGDSGTNEVHALTIGAITGGPFRHGEVVTGTGTGEEGVVIGDTWTGTVILYVEDTAGDGFTNGTITGADSGATATVSATAALRPHAYRLAADEDSSPTLTMGMFTDGKLLQGYGARGNFALRLDHANRAFLDFTFRGIVRNASGSPHTDAALLTGVTIFDRTAPAALNLALVLNDGTLSVSPVFNSMTLDAGGTPSLREDTNSVGGWDVARLTNRQPRLTMNPDEVLTASYTFVKNLIQGITARGRFTLGSTAGNRFTFILPFLSTDSLNGTDREGIRAWDGTFRATNGTYVASGETAFGANNSIVIIHS